MLRETPILSKKSLWFALLPQKPFGFLENLSGDEVVLSESPDSKFFSVFPTNGILMLFVNVENKRS